MGKCLCGSAVQHLSMSLYTGRMFVFGLAQHQRSLSHHVHVHFHGKINVLLQDPLSEKSLEMPRKSVCLKTHRTQLEFSHLEMIIVSS